jgi:hypothetical protein
MNSLIKPYNLPAMKNWFGRCLLAAAGDDVNIDNRTEAIPHSIINPSILFDELEVKRQNVSKGKLPEYPPPPLVSEK